MKKETASIILLLLLIITACAGCENDVTENPAQSFETEAIETIDPNATVLELITDGMASFKIAEPYKKSESYIFEAFESVKSIIRNYLGIEPEVSSGVPDGNEIIIGNRGRKELDAFTEKKYLSKDYFIGVLDNKFIIYAKSREAMNYALCDFEALIKAKAEKDPKNIRLISTENKEAVMKKVILFGKKLSENPIVYKKDHVYSTELLAYKLRADLSKAVGEIFTVYNDTDKAVKDIENAIVIGDTVFGDMPDCNGFEYRIEEKEGRLHLYSSTPDGYTELLDAVQGVLLSDSLSASGSAAPSDATYLKSYRDRDVRIYIHNVYGHDAADTPLEERVRLMTEMIGSYSPDIVGFQECSPTIRNKFRISAYMTTYGYTEVPVKPTNEKKCNYTPLYYKADLFDIVDMGYDYFEGEKNDSGSKTATWAVFKDRKSGKLFAVLSTHFYWQSDSGPERIQNAKQVLARCKQIADKYGCPVIAGGDLNTKYNTDPTRILKNGGLKHIYELAEKRNEVSSHHSYPIFDKEYGYFTLLNGPTNSYLSSIDHIFAYNYEGITLKNYYILADELALMTSDHCPIITDFTFNQ